MAAQKRYNHARTVGEDELERFCGEARKVMPRIPIGAFAFGHTTNTTLECSSTFIFSDITTLSSMI